MPADDPYKDCLPRAFECYGKALNVLARLSYDLPSADMGNVTLIIRNCAESPIHTISQSGMTHVNTPVALRNSTCLKKSLRLARIPLMEYVAILIKKGFDEFLHVCTRHLALMNWLTLLHGTHLTLLL